MVKVALWLVKVALWFGQSGALVGKSGTLVGQSGALGHQSGTLVWSKWRFDVMQAHFWWTLKNDSSSLANSETKAPSKCLSKCLSKCNFMPAIKSVQSFKNVTSQVSAQWRTQAPAHICHPTPKMFPPKCPKHTPVCAHICHPTPPRQNSCL